MDGIERAKFDVILACNPTWEELVALGLDIEVTSIRLAIYDHVRKHFGLRTMGTNHLSRQDLHRFCRKYGRASQAISEFRALQVGY